MVTVGPAASAQERALNQGHPVRLDDAYPIAAGDATLLVDVELKGLATRSATVGLLPLLFHLNAAAQFRATHLGSDEHLVRYHLVAGSSFAIPQQATTTLVGDVFADQALRRGQRETIGVE